MSRKYYTPPVVIAVSPFWAALAGLIYFILWAVFIVVFLVLAIPALLVVVLWNFAQGVREAFKGGTENG